MCNDYIVACEGQLTPVGVTLFNILSGFLLEVFSIWTRCMPPTKVKQGLAGTRAPMLPQIKLHEGLYYQKMCCQEYLIMECFNICSPR